MAQPCGVLCGQPCPVLNRLGSGIWLTSQAEKGTGPQQSLQPGLQAQVGICAYNARCALADMIFYSPGPCGRQGFYLKLKYLRDLGQQYPLNAQFRRDCQGQGQGRNVIVFPIKSQA